MGLAPLASRVISRSRVRNWANRNGLQEPDDLLEEVLAGEMDGFNIFREAVGKDPLPGDPLPYLGRSDRHLVWCTPSEDIQGLRDSRATATELLEALGLPWREEAIEILYPASAVGQLYKPSAVHAGPNPHFKVTDEDSEFGRTSGDLREAIHLPLSVAEAMDNGARFQRWRM